MHNRGKKKKIKVKIIKEIIKQLKVADNFHRAYGNDIFINVYEKLIKHIFYLFKIRKYRINLGKKTIYIKISKF